jgi:tetratricopeptide (TPR) repeat protein
VFPFPSEIEARDHLRHLKALTHIAEVPSGEAVERIGHLVDLASHFDDAEATRIALSWCDAVEPRVTKPGERSQLNYFRSNAWDNEREHKRHLDSADAVWSWEQTELREQLLSLRRAVDPEGLAELEPIARAQILTNLANQFSTAGRIVDAVEYWNRAIAEVPNFAMALGTRGQGWFAYGRAHYDHGHQRVILHRAHGSLSAALADGSNWASAPKGAKGSFAELRAHIESMIDIPEFNPKLDGYGLGRSQVERAYRRWALDNRLFLNPLNDLGSNDIAAIDVLGLPNFRAGLDEGPTLIGFFNQLKQEYISARWLLYEGTASERPHFSDRGTGLHDTLDDPGYSLSIEKTKLAFRSAYSLLDKVAFFLNDYLKLEIPARAVSFRSLWFVKPDELRPAFTGSKNWPLRGLYWLAKDFVEEDFQSTTEPDARDVAIIRNHLEHRYLKVHDRDPFFRCAIPPVYKDRLALSIERPDLEAKALRILKLARAAMIYLSLAMKREEDIRAKAEEGFIIPMGLPPLDHRRQR